jgi:hypothetical protein
VFTVPDKARWPEPAIPPDQPDRYSDYFGGRAQETLHLRGVPELAEYMVTALPKEFEFLTFSFTVYRYTDASPWLVDVIVFGLEEDDLGTELADAVSTNVRDKVDAYNWEHHGIPRFVVGGVLLLDSIEQQRYASDVVTVLDLHRREGER